MDLGKEFLQGIEKAFSEQSFDTEDSIVSYGDSGTYLCDLEKETIRVKAELLKQDSIGSIVHWIQVEKDLQPGEERKEIAAISERLQNHLNYLLEPLKIVELDEPHAWFQMRSAPPESYDQNLAYFELVVRSGVWFGKRNVAHLTRYRCPLQGKRETVSFALTKRQLEKLIDDLAVCL